MGEYCRLTGSFEGLISGKRRLKSKGEEADERVPKKVKTLKRWSCHKKRSTRKLSTIPEESTSIEHEPVLTVCNAEKIVDSSGCKEEQKKLISHPWLSWVHHLTNDDILEHTPQPDEGEMCTLEKELDKILKKVIDGSDLDSMDDCEQVKPDHKDDYGILDSMGDYEQVKPDHKGDNRIIVLALPVPA